MASGNFDGSSFASGSGNFDVDVSARGFVPEPYHDPRIMRDDEEMMKHAALFITLIDP